MSQRVRHRVGGLGQFVFAATIVSLGFEEQLAGGVELVVRDTEIPFLALAVSGVRY